MLDTSSLGQLKQLKKNIHDATPRIKGLVKGTSKRFGFIIDETNKQEYLLPQNEMERVLPGDYIQAVLKKSEKAENKDDKPIATIEKFFNSSLGSFIGHIKIKNNQYYVLPDHAQMTRWLFIPPKFRKNLHEGDIVSASICQHPFANKGRVQAKIEAVIGQPNDPFIEHRYALVKQGIEDKIWQQDELSAIRQTAEQLLEDKIEQSPTENDLRALHFITIDGTNTQDMDDALYIDKLEDGYLLNVAIADVSSFVEPQSALDKIAAKQASSVYLIGQKISMLPDVLSSNICSLKPNEDRLALVCRIKISLDGEICHTEYQQIVMNSKEKVAYGDAAHYLEGQESQLQPATKTQLSLLSELCKIRFAWREKNALIPDDYADFRYQLDERGKITNIEINKRNHAQKLVEECMLLCNQATANYLSQHQKNGLFLVHKGFKTDQMPGIKKLFKQLDINIDVEQLDELANFQSMYSGIEHLNQDLPLKDILRKKLTRSEWSTESQPHFGLGFNAYTTFTSPIRKYSDLICHRMIKAIAADETYNISNEDIEHLNNANQAVRNAQRDCEMSLKCQYIKQFKGQQYRTEISMINHRMIGVYIAELDVHGQIEMRHLPKGLKFKQDSLQLISEAITYQLNQKIDVILDNIDVAQRQIKLKLAPAEDSKANEV